MGAGASAQAAHLFSPESAVDPDAEWRSEISRELDRLGGNGRPALKRGQSTKYRLEWLKVALHEQGDRLEEALAKDPLAGRHEIMRQEAIKVARSVAANHHRFTVREWQTMKHTELRAQQVREELDRKLRDRARQVDQDRPAWNSLHWAQSTLAGGADSHRRVSTAPASSLTAPLRGMSRRKVKAAGGEAHAAGQRSESPEHETEAEAEQEPEEEEEEGEADGSLEAQQEAVPSSSLSQSSSVTTAVTIEEKAPLESPPPPPPRPLTTARAPEPLAEWRLRVLRAKRKAMMVISVVLAFRGRKHRARGLQRLDSLSYFIEQHLGPELQRFVEEQGLYRSTKNAASELQALAEEVWHEQNYSPFADESELLDNSGPLLPLPHPSSPHILSNGVVSPSAGGTSQITGSSGSFKQPAPPLLRLPVTMSGGGTSGASGRSGSPLLRSRPVNLTPTLHHMSQASVSGGPGDPTSPPIGGAAGSSSHHSSQSGFLPAPHTISGAPSGPSAASASAAASSGCCGNVTPSRALPMLRNSSSRVSTSAGLDADGPIAAAGGPHALGLAGSSRKSHRFSAPGTESVIVTGPGGAPTLVRQGSIEDNSILDAGPAIPTVTATVTPVAAPGAVSGSSKRWSSPRFSRRGGAGGDKPDSASGTSNGAAPSPPPRRWVHHASPLSVTDDMSMVARTQSWAGPSGLAGAPGMHPIRSVGHDGSPGSPKAAGPSPPGGNGSHVAPAPPLLPSPAGRNPRKRRESGLILTASSSTISLPQQPRLRSPSHTGEGGLPYGGSSFAGRSVRYARSGSPGLVSRSGSSVTASALRGRTTRAVNSSMELPSVGVAGSYERPSSLTSVPHERLLISTNTIRRMVRDGRSDELFRRYQEEAAALEKPLRMMQLYANRANARWVEELAGIPASIGSSGSSSSLTGGAAGGGNGAAAASGSSASSSHGAGPGWEPPHVHDASRFIAAVGGAQAGVFRNEVVAMLKAGKMAVQLLAGDDHIIMGNGQAQPLWSADPWDLISTSFPARAAATDLVRRVQLGPRLLMALVMAVDALAGPEAVARLVVVVHMNDTHQEEVVKELRYRKFCGLRPENIILLVQQGRPGYVWEPEQCVFVRDDTSQPASAGSGYAIMQLVWPEEAFQLPDRTRSSGDVSGAAEQPAWLDASARSMAEAEAAAARLVPLGSSVLDYLSERGVEWLLTRRLRDISLYNPEMTLDLDVLAYSLYLHELLGANMSVQVDMVDSVSAAKAAHSGIVLAPPRAPPPSRRAAYVAHGSTAMGRHGLPPRRAGTSVPPPVALGPLRTSSDVVGPAARMEGGLGDAGLHSHIVVDVKNSDTATPRLLQLLNEVRARGKGRLAVSTRRYMWRVDILLSLVQRSSLFHPSLEVAGELAYLTFDMSDITAATDCGARCVAVSTRYPARSLTSAAELEDLMGAISAQDAHAPFRKLAGNISSVYGPPVERTGNPSTSPTRGPNGSSSSRATGRSPSPLRELRPRAPVHRIVVFVADNESTGLAVQLLLNMLKPGRDSVSLVTIASSVLQEPAGRMLLRRHEAMLAKSLVEVTTELLLKDVGSTLVDQLELYCQQADPHLVVMGSQLLATATAPVPSSSSASSAAGAASSGGSGPAASGGGAGGLGSSRTPGGVVPMGSVAASMLRNATRPMLIVKANAKNASMVWDKDKLRVLVEVTHSSRALMRYVCSKLVSPARIDRVYLARGGSKEISHQDLTSSRRLLENFSDIAAQHNLPVVKRALEEPFETGAVKYADQDKANVIVVHAPAGRGVPNSVFNIIRATRSAVLVHKSLEGV